MSLGQGVNCYCTEDKELNESSRFKVTLAKTLDYDIAPKRRATVEVLAVFRGCRARASAGKQ